jgi:glycosyltransferase involved in cell wall biosynthesis
MPKRASVIVATFNRRELLLCVLDALDRQSVNAKEFEVIVVDDGSTDGTAAAVRSRCWAAEISVFQQSNRGPATARNIGLEAARGDIVIFLDDDLIPEKDFIKEHIRSHSRGVGKQAILGPALSLSRYSQPWIVWQQATYEKTYSAFRRNEIQPTFRHFWSGNCSIPRDVLKAVGGFDASFRYGEDIELGYRLRKQDVQFAFNMFASGYHHSSRPLSGWMAAHNAYGHHDVRIFEQSQDDDTELYRDLAERWDARHRGTRLFVRLTSRHRTIRVVVTFLLMFCAQAARIAPRSTVAHLSCSLLANLLYWSGVLSELDADSSLFSKLDALLRDDPGTEI